MSNVPPGLRYAKSHEWLKLESDGTVRSPERRVPLPLEDLEDSAANLEVVVDDEDRDVARR